MTRGEFDRELVEHLPFLRAYARARLRLDREAIDDAIQATALRALERRGQYHDMGDGLRPWLTIILRNIVIDGARRPINKPGLQMVEDLSAIGPAADFAVQLGEIKRALDLLCADQQRVFWRLWGWCSAWISGSTSPSRAAARPERR